MSLRDAARPRRLGYVHATFSHPIDSPSFGCLKIEASTFLAASFMPLDKRNALAITDAVLHAMRDDRHQSAMILVRLPVARM